MFMFYLRRFDSTGNESNFRTSAYEALASYVTHAGPESIPVVQNTALTVLSRMEQLLAMQNQLLGIDDRNNWNELQSNLCSVLIVRSSRYFYSNGLSDFNHRASFAS